MGLPICDTWIIRRYAHSVPLGIVLQLFHIAPKYEDARAYLEWLLDQFTADDTPLDEIIEPAALDLLAERLSTPLQFTEYLSRAMDVGFRTGQKPITPELVSATLAPDFDDLEPRLTRQGYSVKVLSDQFQSKPIEIKRFLSGQLEPARTRELAERMRMAGLSL